MPSTTKPPSGNVGDAIQLNNDGKWYPAHVPADSDKIQLAHESFENPIDAIRWCNLFFS
jgi:hypothetical protein